MALVKKFLWLVLAIVVGAFCLLNPHLVSINLFFVRLQLPLALALIISCVTGIVLSEVFGGLKRCLRGRSA